MIKELIIHLGDRKTGTTSIQTALASHSWHCNTAKLVYPSRWNHNPLANAIGREKTPQVLAKRGKALRERLLKSDADFGVISAEHFEVVPPQFLAEFLDTYLPELRQSLRLIAYIRPHADRLLSSFAERSKLGSRCGSPTQLHRTFLATGFLRYGPRLKAWREVFGQQITFRPFERSFLYKEDAVEDFFKFVFGTHAYSLQQQPRRNESLCLEDLVLLREVHRVLRERFGGRLNKGTQEAFGRRMAIVLANSGAQGTRLRLHRRLAEDVVMAYHDDAITIDQEFFSGNPMHNALKSHRDKVIEEEQSLDVADYYSQEAIRQMHCWAEFIGRLMVNNQENFLTNSMPPELRPGQAYQNKAASKKATPD